MYEAPPSFTPPVRWPRTLLLPPRRRPQDYRNLWYTLILALLQLGATWGGLYDALPGRWVPISGCLALVLGPLAELVPGTWQLPASLLRLSATLLWGIGSLGVGVFLVVG